LNKLNSITEVSNAELTNIEGKETKLSYYIGWIVGTIDYMVRATTREVTDSDSPAVEMAFK